MKTGSTWLPESAKPVVLSLSDIRHVAVNGQRLAALALWFKAMYCILRAP